MNPKVSMLSSNKSPALVCFRRRKGPTTSCTITSSSNPRVCVTSYHRKDSLWPFSHHGADPLHYLNTRRLLGFHLFSVSTRGSE